MKGNTIYRLFYVFSYKIHSNFCFFYTIILPFPLPLKLVMIMLIMNYDSPSMTSIQTEHARKTIRIFIYLKNNWHAVFLNVLTLQGHQPILWSVFFKVFRIAINPGQILIFHCKCYVCKKGILWYSKCHWICVKLHPFSSSCEIWIDSNALDTYFCNSLKGKLTRFFSRKEPSTFDDFQLARTLWKINCQKPTKIIWNLQTHSDWKQCILFHLLHIPYNLLD